MKCPICQTELVPFNEVAPNVMQCPQPCPSEGGNHLYQRDTKHPTEVESYVYRGYMVITSADHPMMHIPLTSFYLDTEHAMARPERPAHEVEKHLTFAEIQQLIQELEQAVLN